MINYLRSKFSNKKAPCIKERSNVIQYDEMGYPLRLIINHKGKQVWLDTYEEDGDVILEWKKTTL